MYEVVHAGVVYAADRAERRPAHVLRAHAPGQLVQRAVDRQRVQAEGEQLLRQPALQLAPAGDEAAELVALRQRRDALAVALRIVGSQSVEYQHDVYVAFLARLSARPGALYAHEVHALCAELALDGLAPKLQPLVQLHVIYLLALDSAAQRGRGLYIIIYQPRSARSAAGEGAVSIPMRGIRRPSMETKVCAIRLYNAQISCQGADKRHNYLIFS